jgi:hypothetical protein
MTPETRHARTLLFFAASILAACGPTTSHPQTTVRSALPVPAGPAPIILTQHEAGPAGTAREEQTGGTNAQASAPTQPLTSTEPLEVSKIFHATGWMGDGEKGSKYLEFVESDATLPHSAPSSTKVHYTLGPQGWAGIYWQNLPENWGDQPGENLAPRRYKRITFWARGENGGEIVEFKAGDINRSPPKPFKDSFRATAGKVTLTKEWAPYSIDLTGINLTSVIGGFCWVANKAGNPKGLTFWLDDIRYEG